MTKKRESVMKAGKNKLVIQTCGFVLKTGALDKNSKNVDKKT
jgi:hypothetical protein